MSEKLKKSKIYIIKLDSNNIRDYLLFLKLLNTVYTSFKNKNKSVNYVYITPTILNLFNTVNLLYNSYPKPNSNF